MFKHHNANLTNSGKWPVGRTDYNGFHNLPMQYSVLHCVFQCTTVQRGSVLYVFVLMNPLCLYVLLRALVLLHYVCSSASH